MPSALLDLHFDKGNGALFKVEYAGACVSCFLDQSNEFFAKKANPGQNFPSVVQRYSELLALAAKINIDRVGAIAQDAWGNLISEQDLLAAQEARRSAG